MVKVDIFFFNWNSFYGKLIQLGTGSKWTHIGIGIKGKNGYTIYEAVNRGLVKSNYPNKFLDQKIKDGTIAHKKITINISKAKLQQICEQYLGEPYDWVSIFNIGFHFFFGRFALNFSGPRTVICSEFVARVLYEASKGKINFEEEYDKKFDYITPADIWRSKFLK